MAQPPEADLAGAASHTPQAEALAGVGWLSSGGADPLSYRGEELGQVVKLFEFHHALGFLLIPLAVTYVLVLRCVFKSWTLNGAAASYKAGDSFEDRYRMAFDRRAELESQLHWARERGDAASATTIQQQMVEVDEGIDEMEAMVTAKKRSGGKALPKGRGSGGVLRQRGKGGKGEERL